MTEYLPKLAAMLAQLVPAKPIDIATLRETIDDVIARPMAPRLVLAS